MSNSCTHPCERRTETTPHRSFKQWIPTSLKRQDPSFLEQKNKPISSNLSSNRSLLIHVDDNPSLPTQLFAHIDKKSYTTPRLLAPVSLHKNRKSLCFRNQHASFEVRQNRSYGFLLSLHPLLKITSSSFTAQEQEVPLFQKSLLPSPLSEAIVEDAGRQQTGSGNEGTHWRLREKRPVNSFDFWDQAAMTAWTWARKWEEILASFGSDTAVGYDFLEEALHAIGLVHGLQGIE